MIVVWTLVLISSPLSLHLFVPVINYTIFNLILVISFEFSVELIHLLNFTEFVLSSPFIVGVHLAHQEVLGFLEARGNLSEVSLNVLLLLLQTLNVLFHLIDTDLEAVVLRILIIHC